MKSTVRVLNVALLLVCVLGCCCVNGLIVQRGEETLLDTEMISVSGLWTGGQVQGRVNRGVVGSFNFFNISGVVFLAQDDRSFIMSRGSLFDELVEMGAVSVFVLDTSIVLGRKFCFYTSESDVPLGAIHVSNRQALMGFNEGDELVVIVDQESIVENTWKRSTTLIVMVQVTMSIIGLVPLFFSSTKLFMFFDDLKNKLSYVAIICLVFNLLGDIFRLCHYIVDPWGVMPFYWTFPFMYLASPFSVGSALLVILYWIETVRPTSLIPHEFLDQFYYPYMVAMIIIMLINFVWIPINFIDQALGVYLVSLNLILYCILSVIYVIVGAKLIESITRSGRPHKKIRSLTNKIIAAAIIMILNAILDAGVVLIRFIPEIPALGTVFILFFRFGAFSAISVIFSIMFRPRNGYLSTDRSTKSKRVRDSQTKGEKE